MTNKLYYADANFPTHALMNSPIDTNFDDKTIAFIDRNVYIEIFNIIYTYPK